MQSGSRHVTHAVGTVRQSACASVESSVHSNVSGSSFQQPPPKQGGLALAGWHAPVLLVAEHPRVHEVAAHERHPRNGGRFPSADIKAHCSVGCETTTFGRQAMATLYKGAGPGTHWWTTDARTAGGFFCPPGRPPSASAVASHITVGSHPSPYLSFTTSFAIALEYALSGPGGAATSTTPGYVYVLDTTLSPLTLVDPVHEIAMGHQVAGRWSTEHDGGPDLVLGIAAPGLHPSALTGAPRRRGGSLSRPPSVTTELNALIFSLRDAEVLISGTVPPSCLVGRDPVW